VTRVPSIIPTISAPEPEPVGQPVPTLPPAAPVTINVRARNLVFNTEAINVALGSRVTLVLQNDDPGIFHNIGVNMLGVDLTETCAGPCTRSKTFIAQAGSYQFFCNLHVGMVGSFTVQ
jgi:plastocyanin